MSSFTTVTTIYGRGQATQLIAGGRRKIHTTYEAPANFEMVEEYDLQTDELLIRKTKPKSALGNEKAWVYEIGEPPLIVTNNNTNNNNNNNNNTLIKESTLNPIFVRQDSPKHFLFRIRNLPYSTDVFNVEIDTKTNEIVIKTSNKKYYKRISIPELKILKYELKSNELNWNFANNTLIIQYNKPQTILDMEAQAKKLRLSQPANTMDTNPDNPSECKQQ